MLIDALVFAARYALRIVAGTAAFNVAPSFWMLLFSVLLFLSLAFVKRFAELEALRLQNQLRAIGPGYEIKNLPILQSLGSCARYLSVLILALYINSSEIEALHHQSQVIWILCVLLLFWTSRLWVIAQTECDARRPGVFASKDRLSLGAGLLALLTLLFAQRSS